MGQRLSVKNKKQRRDKLTAEKNGTAPKAHKVAVERSKKARFRANNPMR
jgi:hypothetical protein